MPACNSCGSVVKKRQWCPNHCQAMLCADCAKPPEGWPGSPQMVRTIIGQAVEWVANRCRFCYRRGEPLNGVEFKKLKVGDWFWVVWCKDDNPEYLRFNCPQRIVEVQETGRILCANWSFGKPRTGWDNEWGSPDDDSYNAHDTSRGTAYYFRFLDLS